MKKLSTGEDSTLGNHRKMAVAVFGGTSSAVKFLDDKIVSSKRGEAEEVLAEEVQFVHALAQLHFKGYDR